MPDIFDQLAAEMTQPPAADAPPEKHDIFDTLASKYQFGPKIPGPEDIPQLKAAPPVGIVEKVRENLSPLFGPTARQRAMDSIPNPDTGEPEYKPMGGKIEQEGFFPGVASALSTPIPAVEKIHVDPVSVQHAVNKVLGRKANLDEVGTTAGVATGIANAGINFAKFFTTPMGMSTAGIGSAPRWVKQAVGLYFAQQMARQVPETAQALGASTVSGTTAEKVENSLNLAGDVLFPADIGAEIHPFRGKGERLAREIKEQVGQTQLPPGIIKFGEPVATFQERPNTDVPDGFHYEAGPDGKWDLVPTVLPSRDELNNIIRQQVAPVPTRNRLRVPLATQPEPPTSPLPELNQPTPGEPNAPSRIRINPQPPEKVGQVPQSGQVGGGGNLQQTPPRPPEPVVEGEKGKAPQPNAPVKVGDPANIMGVDSVLHDSWTIGGVRYDIFKPAKEGEARAAVRVTDVDSGNVVTLKQYPTFDAAQADYAKALAANKTPPKMPDAAGRLVQLKALPNPTPEEIAERDALQAKSDAAKKAAWPGFTKPGSKPTAPPTVEPASPEAVKPAEAPVVPELLTKQGQPKTFFHGTRESLTGGLKVGLGKNRERGLHEEGIWFAPNRGKDFDSSSISDATRYSGDEGTVVSATLDIKNPYYGDVNDLAEDKINTKWLRDHGYDGFIDKYSGSGLVAVIDPAQVHEISRESLKPTEAPKQAEPPETVTSLADTSKFPIVQLPVKSLKLSADVPNFKSNASEDTGVVEGEQLEGKFEQLGTGPITVWQRQNGDLEVVSGRHRLDLAKRTNTETIAAQVLKEAEGWTPQKVATLDAEMNIRDGQGTVFDYANFFKHSDITEPAATERGLLARAKGRAGYQLGRNASPDLYAAYRAGRVSEQQAVVIAESAPGNADLQQVGVKAALNGAKPEEIRGRMEAASNAATTSKPASQTDFFADTSLNEAWEKQGAYVAARRKELQDIISTRKAVVGKYDVATATGSIKATKAKAQAELESAQAELARWQEWGKHPDLRAEVENLGKRTVAPPVVTEQEAAAASSRIAKMFGGEPKTKTASELFGKETPFNLEAPKPAEKPAETTTGYGGDTMAQQEMFAIQKIVESKNPEKSANEAQKIAGGDAAKAAAMLRRQLAVVDSDKVTKKAFVKEQRQRLAAVISLLEQRSRQAQLDSHPSGFVREGEAQGPAAIRQLIASSNLPENVVQTFLAVLDTPVMRNLDWSRLTVDLRNELEGGVRGAATVSQNLIELSGGATADTFPHEVFHFLYNALPDSYKATLNEMRLEALRKIYGDNIPEALRRGDMTTAQFQQANLPNEVYPLTTPSEFLSDVAGKSFADRAFKERHQVAFVGQIRAWVRGLVNALKRTLRIRPDLQRITDELWNGIWKTTPESGRAYEERQGQLPRTVKEYEKQKTFEEPATPERVMGAFGDVVEMKNREADAINASPEARSLVNQFYGAHSNQELLTQMASADLGMQRLVFGNYEQMRLRTEGSDQGLRSSVIIDAFRGLGYEQHRAIKLREKLAAQQELVASKSFQNKLSRFWETKTRAEDAEEIRKTFQNQIAQEAGDVLREMSQKGKTEAQLDQLRSDLARLERMPDFSAAVTQRVQDIINVVSSSEGGVRLLSGLGSKNGTEIYRAYLDIKDSIAKAQASKPGLAGMVDESMLSPEDLARVRASQEPALSSDQKVLAQLASSVLAANGELRMRLLGVEYARMHPEFKAAVTEVGEKFRKQFEADPNNAIKQIVKMSASLKAKEMNAEAAWLRLNKAVLPELKKLQALEEAVEIDNRVQNSPQWKQLVNQILKDNSGLSPALRIPDSEIPHVTANNVWNEFTGKTQLRSPLGGIFDVDIGFTKASAVESQNRMQSFLDETQSWLSDPKNADNPDRNYWQTKHDFVESVLNSSTVLNPTVRYPIAGRGPWGMLQFLVENASLPAAKLVGIASSNFSRAYSIADMWYQSHPQVLTLLAKAARSHGYNPDMDIKLYQQDVLNRLASEYRHGHALHAGERLSNGMVITQADINALKFQGGKINELFNLQKNIAREKVMVNGVLLDEWAKNIFGIRSAQELGAEPGTTLPREFSEQGKSLSRRVAALSAADYNGMENIFNEPRIFDEYVKRFFGERGAEFSTPSPFEPLYKQLAEMWRMGDPAAPNSIGEIADWIAANTGEKYEPGQIRQHIIGEMSSQLRKFNRDFVSKEEATDTRADRATKSTAFTQGFERDIGSSYFYDYGAVSALEMRSLAMDSTNFHLVRLVKSLDATVEAYDKALAEFKTSAEPSAKEQRKLIKGQRAAFESGEDFRDFEHLQSDRNNFAYMRDTWTRAFGSSQVHTVELFSKFGRFTGDAISSALSGLLTTTKVFFGSTVKMGLVSGGMQRWYMLGAGVRGLVSTAMSAAGITTRAAAKGLIKSPEMAYKFGRTVVKEGPAMAFGKAVETAIEGLYHQAKFFNEQNQMGLGFKAPAGFRAWNILRQPMSHGGQFQPKLSRNLLARMSGQVLYRAMSAAEFPLEIVKTIFPQMGYTTSYDAAAKQAGQMVDIIGSQARRSFEYLEKRGRLGEFDLNHPSSVKNDIPADMYLPRGLGFLKKGETNAYQARDWWARSIDVPLQEMIINYWRRLAETPPAERGQVSFLASDVADAAKIKQIEDARMAGLATAYIKDVHHSAPENRAIQLRAERMLRFMQPLAGWTLHSIRLTSQLLGRSPRDSRGQVGLLVAGGATLLSFAASCILTGEAEKDAKKVVTEDLNGDIYPEKTVLEAGSPTELSKLLGIDAVGWIPQVHNLASELMGESSQTVSEFGVTIFPVQKLDSLLRYAKGVIATGDPYYGLASLAKQTAPFLRRYINRMDSQEGLVNLRDARAIADKFGPEDLLGKKGPSEPSQPTVLSPLRQQLYNAIYKGDQQGINDAAKAFLDEAISTGRTPEQAHTLLRDAMNFADPSAIAGTKMTDAQHSDYLSKLPTGYAAKVAAAEQNWSNAMQQLGMTGQLTKGDRTLAAGGRSTGGSGGAISISSPSSIVRGRRASRSGNRLRVRRGTSRTRTPRVHMAKLRVPHSHYRVAKNRLRRRRSAVYA